ncbi:MAG: polysaccharide biosynthesis tyrosine autokinase [Candidatus Omnitrophota bacterium]
MQTEELTSSSLRDYVRILFRRKDAVIMSMVTVISVVLWGLLLQTPVYEAQVKMLISAEKQVQSPYFRELMGDRNTEASVTQSEIVISRPVLERVVRALSLHLRPADYERKYASPLKKLVMDFQVKHVQPKKSSLSPEETEKLAFNRTIAGLKKSIKVVPVRDTNIFVISVRDVDPVVAASIANVASRSYIVFDLEQQLAELTQKYGEKHPAVLQLQDNINRLLKSLNAEALSNSDAIGPASVKIIEQASVPLKTTGNSRITMFLLGILVSVLLGIFLAFVFEYMDPSFHSAGDVERELKLSVLGNVPLRKRRESKLITPADQNAFVHAFQEICDQIRFQIADKGIKSILVVSSGSKEGTSTLTANLGLFLAQRAGYEVLVIDTNLRNPSQHNFFKLGNIAGFAEIVEGKVGFEAAIKSVGKKLNVIVAGKTAVNPAILIDSPKVKELLSAASKIYQVVLVDGPNLASHRDALALAALTDAAVLVISEGQTRRQVIKATVEPLVERKTNILGAIVNRRRFDIPKFIYDRL